MKKFGFIILLVFFFFTGFTQSPVTWRFAATKGDDPSVYFIHCTAKVSAPWHIYSQFTPAGGPIPTKFTVTKNPLYTVVGKSSEEGKLITKNEPVFGIDVKFFEEEVDFVQKILVKVKAATNYSGSVEYMVCNDKECLPPTNLKFSVPLN